MLHVINAKNKMPVPVVNSITLHSRVDPLAEGQKQADFFLQHNQSNNQHLLVLGLGFGYHIMPLIGKYKHITVLEPDQELINTAQQQFICSGVVDMCQIVSSTSQIEQANWDVFIFPPARRLYPNLAIELQTIAQQGQTKAGTTPKLNSTWLRVLTSWPIYGGSLTVARYVDTALKTLGCRVQTADNTCANGLLQQILTTPNKLKHNLSNRLVDMLSDLFWQQFTTFKPHLCFFNAQAPVSKDLLRKIRATGCATVFWFVEDWRRFAYWKDYAKEFDLFLTIQQGELYEKLPDANLAYLPVAADEHTHQPLKLTPQEQNYWGSDVSFMGAGYPNRHTLFSQLTNYNLKLWGTDWDNNPALAPYVQHNGQRVTPEEIVKIFNATKININLHSSMESNIFEQTPDFVNPRTFEIAACGGFQLVDERTLLPALLEPGKEIVTFNSLNDLRKKIDYYLAHPDERTAIAQAARNKVLKQHTYTHRMQQLLALLEHRHPQWYQGVLNAGIVADQTVNNLADPDFKQFLASLPGRDNISLPYLVNQVKQHQGPLTSWQALVLMLDEYASLKKLP